MTEIFEYIASISFVASFLAPILGGEMAVILLAFLSAQGGFNLWVVIIFSFFGMVAIDSFWFWATRSPWADKLTSKMRNAESYAKLEKKIENISHRSDIAILLISKILVGTRILILIYLSMRKMSFIKFLGYNSVATFVWAIMLGYFGWFAGQGFYNLSKTYDYITTAVFSLIGVVVGYYVITYLIRLWINRK